MTATPTLLETEAGDAILELECANEMLSPTSARALVEAVRAQSGRLRRRGLFDQFDAVLSHDD